MRLLVAIASLLLAASSAAQSVPVGVAPSASAPPGCKSSYDGNFTIFIEGLNPAKRDPGRDKRDEQVLGAIVTLSKGVLTDSLGRTGAIVSNHQFQFDGPPQAGSIYTGGFGVCANNSLSLGGTTMFWRCLSGSFNNLYNENVAPQCAPASIAVSALGQSSSTSSAASSTASFTASGTAPSSASASKTGSSSASGSSASGSASKSGSTSASSGASSTGRSSASATATGSASTKASASSSAAGATQAPSASTGAAVVATRVSRRETFAAVVGLLGAVFFV